MRGLVKLTGTELRLFLREPTAVFFTLAFPVMMLFLFGSIFGNDPVPGSGGKTTVEISVPSYSALIVAVSGLLTMVTHVSTYRERGIFRRLQVAPVRLVTVLASIAGVVLLFTLVGIALLLVAGHFAYGVGIVSDVVSFTAAVCLSCAAFFALGFFLAALVPNARTGQAVASIIFFPMIFISGATLPLELLPDGLRRVSATLPLTHAVELLRGIWEGGGWSGHGDDVVFLVAVAVGAAGLASKVTRWGTW